MTWASWSVTCTSNVHVPVASGSPEIVPLLKVAQHDGGISTTASSRTQTIDAAGRRRVVEHVEQWLPGLVPVPAAASTCLYTTTPDEDFVLDRVGPVVVLSPCSGHGAKFAPLIGEIAADLASGGPHPYPRFGLACA
jgi:glycine/D-amino acid oxidase-like deaminating enzyme